jgi:hypothetical protein
MILENVALHRGDLRVARDGSGLPVGNEPERDSALGDRISEVAPGVDDLVELEMQRPEVRADDGPVQLFLIEPVDPARPASLVARLLASKWRCRESR